MRTPHIVPKGWVNRSQAARYLGVSEWKWVQLVQKHALLTRLDKGVNIYRISDVEAMARILGELS